MPTIADVAEPMLRLAGHRINPRTNGPHLLKIQTGLTLKTIAGGAERAVVLPAGANVFRMEFSPTASASRSPLPACPASSCGSLTLHLDADDG